MLEVKNLPANSGDVRDRSSVPGLGRSPGKGNGYPLQYSFRGNPWNEDVGGLQFMGLQRVEQSN